MDQILDDKTVDRVQQRFEENARWKSDVGLVVKFSDVNKLLAQFSPGNVDITSTSSLFWQTLALVSEASARISCGFLCEGVLGS